MWVNIGCRSPRDATRIKWQLTQTCINYKQKIRIRFGLGVILSGYLRSRQPICSKTYATKDCSGNDDFSRISRKLREYEYSRENEEKILFEILSFAIYSKIIEIDVESEPLNNYRNLCLSFIDINMENIICHNWRDIASSMDIFFKFLFIVVPFLFSYLHVPEMNNNMCSPINISILVKDVWIYFSNFYLSFYLLFHIYTCQKWISVV